VCVVWLCIFEQKKDWLIAKGVCKAVVTMCIALQDLVRFALILCALGVGRVDPVILDVNRDRVWKAGVDHKRMVKPC